MVWPFKKKVPSGEFPPVPKWRPEIRQPIDRIIERVANYTERKQDFVVFTYGTCAFVPNGLSEPQAITAATEILARIFNYHPDMTPTPMDDGNLVVQYKHPALNVVLTEFAQEHWSEIDRHHLDALATSEVLITPLGPNKFDDIGKRALFGRCFMFMDAKSPKATHVVRATA